MRLFIAEKPSLAKGIAAVLGQTGKGKGFIECGSDVVTWFFGHMLEQADPDTYTAEDAPRTDKGKKIWRTEDLPIIPTEWKYNAREDAQEQLDIVKKLYEKADEIVHAGDPDREGQLLVDQPIKLLFGEGKPVKRFWASALDATSVKRALDGMKPNEDFAGYANAAEARGRADWLIGMNLSRAFTLKAMRGGSRALLTVGRVQTPTLNLVVIRDRAIEGFKPIPFHGIRAAFKHENGQFLADWRASETQEGLDEEGRLTKTSVADALVKSLSGQTAKITTYKQEPKSAGQPKGLSQTDITALAAKAFGYTGAQVLATCQSLYETHKLTTYPRTDCSYLPESQHSDAAEILGILKDVVPHLNGLIEGANPKIKSKTWNDAKVTAHHGIIPTVTRGDVSKLSEAERNIYDLVVRYYLAQFYPAHEFLKTSVGLDLAGELFVAHGNVVTKSGWHEVFGADDSSESDDGSEGDSESLDSQSLPRMEEGDAAACLKVLRRDSKTKPPARFTEGTLPQAMENVHKFVDDKEHKKLLREGDGIGTTATRSGIIEELKARNFLASKGKALVSTELGRSMIDALPEAVKSPVLTAMFERILSGIESGSADMNDFMAKQEAFVRDQVEKANQGSVKIAGAKQAPVVSKVHFCTQCKKGLIRRAGKKTNTSFWSCSGYPQCSASYPDFKGKPNLSKLNPGKPAAATEA
ncbi:DNA topoisomerase 3 [Pseudomonas syringae]|uniref:DNA topoisomerase 3 n=1 Tax=Pseudomonas syringae TaxID=317 RepID=UPI002009E0F2|nr:DNA topoisomerase 3 [Pseudomonas syringae]MCK9709864.1 DNA topoisomerase 3 [Pseudomonas syringae pv. syringae]